MKPARVLKYRFLKSLPGAIGRRYEEKFQRNAHTLAFEDALNKTRGMLSIDLGANVGEYTLRMARNASEVIAFEPDPWTVGVLRNAVAAQPNVAVVEAAAGTRDGTIRFFRHMDFETDRVSKSQSGTIYAEKDNVDKTVAIDVVAVDFLAYLRALNRDVGVLKMDIEGAEVDLLEQLLNAPDVLGRIRYIFAETHEDKIPGHRPRVDALRRRAADLASPVINLNWH
ncbi:FkbM family methyltransferase [Boseongicola sp. H5]|uniref:FkbM family methyltransferase n=1 Tax=Boseongicola sp. H5 TaxID=2763261 RepID=UPI001D0BBBBB|nr:FkbM family methyltransferase [Boseongicola sp. H5]